MIVAELIKENPEAVGEYQKVFSDDSGSGSQWISYSIGESAEISKVSVDSDDDDDLGEAFKDLFGELDADSFDDDDFLSDDIECDDDEVELVG
jgi:hypothetical protein